MLNSWLSDELAISHPRAYSFAMHEDISVQSFLAADNLAALLHLPLSPQALDEVRILQELTAHVTMDNSLDRDDWIFVWGARTYSSNITISASEM